VFFFFFFWFPNPNEFVICVEMLLMVIFFFFFKQSLVFIFFFYSFFFSFVIFLNYRGPRVFFFFFSVRKCKRARKLRGEVTNGDLFYFIKAKFGVYYSISCFIFSFLPVNFRDSKKSLKRWTGKMPEWEQREDLAHLFCSANKFFYSLLHAIVVILLYVLLVPVSRLVQSGPYSAPSLPVPYVNTFLVPRFPWNPYPCKHERWKCLPSIFTFSSLLSLPFRNCS